MIKGDALSWSIIWLCCCCCYIASVVSDSVLPHRRQPTRLPYFLGFSRQEHWSGLPFPSPLQDSEKWKWSRSVVSTLHDPMDCSPPGSSAHGIFQARVLEWGAIAFSNNMTLQSPFEICKIYLDCKIFSFILLLILSVSKGSSGVVFILGVIYKYKI